MATPLTTAEIIRHYRNEDVARVALEIASHPDRNFILQQIEGWQRLRHKLPAWTEEEELLYPPRLSAEQCSGQVAAEYKARVAADLPTGKRTFIDLTGGFGVDFYYIARHFENAAYVERQAGLTDIVAHNLTLLGLDNAHFFVGNAKNYLEGIKEKIDLIFLDPARRDTSGRKMAALNDCEPNVLSLLPLLKEKARFTMLKLSPMLDIAAACKSLHCVSDVHVVAEKGECKDLLLILSHEAQPLSISITAADSNFRPFRFTPEEEANCKPAYLEERMLEEIRYLYDPSPALLKASALKLPATRLGLMKLHPNTHLYASAACVSDFPGRTFRIVGHCGVSKGELRKAGCHAVHQAHLTTRGFPQSTATLRQQLRMSEGGSEYWFATTIASGAKRLFRCTKTEEE